MTIHSPIWWQCIHQFSDQIFTNLVTIHSPIWWQYIHLSSYTIFTCLVTIYSPIWWQTFTNLVIIYSPPNWIQLILVCSCIIYVSYTIFVFLFLHIFHHSVGNCGNPGLAYKSTPVQLSVCSFAKIELHFNLQSSPVHYYVLVALPNNVFDH
jgi:hypothetical protein